ncbi:MAG: hypothetical protein P4M13_10910 [Alphaproteobacteria bacterium]|nr:hypothetical protein [Alphaproteobacteria bacterium]
MTSARPMKAVLAAVLAVFILGFFAQARAADLPLAAASPLTGVAFDDRPLMLPVQRNFQMAMLTAGSELGRSCGRMEAYGWRMSQTEQARVNQIFNNTVDRLRLLGYTIAPQTLTSVSKDITLFTADRANKHFLFLWSAGELGLVLNLCETTAPAPSYAHAAASLVPSVQVFPVPIDDIPPARFDASDKTKGMIGGEGFSPVGEWVGSYTCAQGLTGGSLQIGRLRGEDFDGVFKFYPTEKNPSVPSGSYTVFGQYDKASKRILINPGKWIKRPHNFYNTVIVGSFDPAKDIFSAYFQGISGCTSFEAHREGAEPISLRHEKLEKHKAVRRVVRKKKKLKKKLPPPQATQKTLEAPTMAAPTPIAPVPAAGDSKPVAPTQGSDSSVDDKKVPATGIILAAPPAPSGK